MKGFIGNSQYPELHFEEKKKPGSPYSYGVVGS